MRFPILFFQIKTKNLFCQLEGAPKDWCSGTNGLVHGHHSFGALILQLSFFWIYVPFCNELLISLDHKGTGKREKQIYVLNFFNLIIHSKISGQGNHLVCTKVLVPGHQNYDLFVNKISAEYFITFLPTR